MFKSFKDITDKYDIVFYNNEYKYEKDIIKIFNNKRLNKNNHIPDDILINCKAFYNHHISKNYDDAKKYFYEV